MIWGYRGKDVIRYEEDLLLGKGNGWVVGCVGWEEIGKVAVEEKVLVGVLWTFSVGFGGYSAGLTDGRFWGLG